MLEATFITSQCDFKRVNRSVQLAPRLISSAAATRVGYFCCTIALQTEEHHVSVERGDGTRLFKQTCRRTRLVEPAPSNSRLILSTSPGCRRLDILYLVALRKRKLDESLRLERCTSRILIRVYHAVLRVEDLVVNCTGGAHTSCVPSVSVWLCVGVHAAIGCVWFGCVTAPLGRRGGGA